MLTVVCRSLVGPPKVSLHECRLLGDVLLIVRYAPFATLEGAMTAMAEASTKEYRQELQAHPKDLARIRRIVAAHLRHWGHGELVAPATMCVTELLANVNKHTYSADCVLILQDQPDALRLTVSDTSTALPIVVEPDWLAEHGRGMFLLSKTADRWGATTTAEGKDVWIEFCTAREGAVDAAPPAMTLLITGAAGTIGTRLAADLAAQGVPLRLLDRRPPTAGPPPGAEFVQADLRDQAAVEKAAAGISAVVHLAGITHEGPFAEMVEHNITGTYHVLEAARRQRVPRVVLASSHHVTGMNPIGEPPQEAPHAPDSFYAVSKVTMEALGHLYAHKSSMQVVAVRIGSYRTRPTEPRHRATWLSPRDATALLYAAATRPLTSQFLTVYGTSGNTESWWPCTGWEALGYQPTDNATQHPHPGQLTDRFQGGAFADHELPTQEHLR
jgi:uronate dehydrogenase